MLFFNFMTLSFSFYNFWRLLNLLQIDRCVQTIETIFLKSLYLSCLAKILATHLI